MNSTNQISQIWLDVYQPKTKVVNDQYMIWKEYPDYVINYITPLNI